MIDRHAVTIFSFDGQEIACEVWTNHPQPTRTLIFGHGLGGDLESNTLVIQHVFETTQLPLRCITFDMRGHGHSTRIFSDLHPLVTTMAHDLHAVLQHFKVNNPILIGQSFFGSLALEYLDAGLDPEPSYLIFINPSFSILPISVNRDFWYQLLKKFQRPHTPRRHSLEQYLAYLNSFDYSPRRLWKDACILGVRRYLLMWASFFGYHHPQTTKLLANVPFTIILGKYDLAVPYAVQQKILRHLPHAQQIVINVNHNAVINAAPDVAKIISETLTSLDASAA